MADTFQLQLVTPEHVLVDEQVTSVEIPGRSGYFGVLAGHAPLLSALDPGVLTFEGGGSEDREFFIDGGFVEVFENHVRVLADHAEPRQNVQAGNAQQQLTEGNEALRKAQTPHEVDAAMAIVKKAQARLDVAGLQHQ
jgi:F-type H+-transporting ATPase subunit epsilon